MRMSSGASDQYEKPRSPTSSCGLLTPRSNSNATISPPSSPFASTISFRCSKPPWTTRTRSPNPASASCAATTATRSRSMPSTDNLGNASRMRPLWPPPPTVQSTTQPGRPGARRSSTSLPITGRCSNTFLSLRRRQFLLTRTRVRHQPPGRSMPSGFLPGSARSKAGGVGAFNRDGRGAGGRPEACVGVCPFRARLLHEVVESFAGADRGGALVHLLAPARRVPDLEVGELPDDEDVTIERRVLPQRLRDRHSALLVGHDFLGTAEQRPRGVPFPVASLGLLVQLGCHLLEVLSRVHPQTPVEALGDDRTVSELVPELRRQDHPPLRVQGVLCFSQEHPNNPSRRCRRLPRKAVAHPFTPLRSTLSHPLPP